MGCSNLVSAYTNIKKEQIFMAFYDDYTAAANLNEEGRG